MSRWEPILAVVAIQLLPICSVSSQNVTNEYLHQYTKDINARKVHPRNILTKPSVTSLAYTFATVTPTTPMLKLTRLVRIPTLCAFCSSAAVTFTGRSATLAFTQPSLG